MSFLCEGEPPPPISTPWGTYRPHKAATRCSEPTWNAHYSSTHHQCWYSFYLPTEGWRAESTPSQVELGAGIEPGTCHMMVCCSTNWAILAGTGMPQNICICMLPVTKFLPAQLPSYCLPCALLFDSTNVFWNTTCTTIVIFGQISTGPMEVFLLWFHECIVLHPQ